MGKVREGSDQRGIDVSGGLRLLVVGPLIGEPVALVGPAHHGAHQDIGVGGRGLHEVEAGGALDLRGVGHHGREG